MKNYFALRLLNFLRLKNYKLNYLLRFLLICDKSIKTELILFCLPLDKFKLQQKMIKTFLTFCMKTLSSFDKNLKNL